MLLRDVHKEDAEALSQLVTHFTQLTTTAAQIQERLARSQGIEHPILAELDGQVVGFASLRLLNYLGEDAPYAEISELFILEPYRRRGIARALLSELEARARAAGASSLTVLTAAAGTFSSSHTGNDVRAISPLSIVADRVSDLGHDLEGLETIDFKRGKGNV